MDELHSSQPSDGSSSYGTPDHDNAMDSSAKDMFSDTDTNLVVGADRFLKTMLGDLAAVLQKRAYAKVFISGEMYLRIDGREDYTLSLLMGYTDDPPSLKVKINQRVAPRGTSKPISSLKRKHDATTVELIDQGTPKRRRTHIESGDKEHANQPPKSPAQTDVIDPNDAADEPTPRRILEKLKNLSEQVHWVE